jgi:hypothetical protein
MHHDLGGTEVVGDRVQVLDGVFQELMRVELIPSVPTCPLSARQLDHSQVPRHAAESRRSDGEDTRGKRPGSPSD